MKKRLIGVAGPMGCGKDEVANALKSIGYFRYALADPIKKLMNELLYWDDRHGFGELKEAVDPAWGVSPRQVYQWFGTEFARERIHYDIWLKRAEMELQKMDGQFLGMVVPDIRFENEAKWIRENGVLIHVKRPGVGFNKSHASEAGVIIRPSDVVIINDGSIDQLHAEVINFEGEYHDGNTHKKVHQYTRDQ